MLKFGEKLRWYRHNANLTIMEVVKLLHKYDYKKSISYYSSLERGESIPPLEAIIKLSHFFEEQLETEVFSILSSLATEDQKEIWEKKIDKKYKLEEGEENENK